MSTALRMRERKPGADIKSRTPALGPGGGGDGAGDRRRGGGSRDAGHGAAVMETGDHNLDAKTTTTKKKKTRNGDGKTGGRADGRADGRTGGRARAGG